MCRRAVIPPGRLKIQIEFGHPVQAAQKRGLACAGRPDNGKDLPLPRFQADAFQNFLISRSERAEFSVFISQRDWAHVTILIPITVHSGASCGFARGS